MGPTNGSNDAFSLFTARAPIALVHPFFPIWTFPTDHPHAIL